ncbi:energy transducer TonB [Porphyrobacter sp. YT40]|uniref:energy transducer TonB n=1 Tax=Porphyrobacter sp. YT40 TaxID=2547601 RepID=UPI002572A91D|nr:energy transducer TonB [Porphyrobacter sp. YT40]
MAMIIAAYPADAQFRGQEGTVGVTVSVSADGRPKGCKVIRSSGHEILDTAACAGMKRYARFDPALDAQGNPIAAEFSTKITYSLDQE